MSFTAYTPVPSYDMIHPERLIKKGRLTPQVCWNKFMEYALIVAKGARNSYRFVHEDSPFGVPHAEHARCLD